MRTEPLAYRASFSGNMNSSVLDEVVEAQTALYGSTPVPDSFGEGMMENVSMMRSGYSSRTVSTACVLSHSDETPRLPQKFRSCHSHWRNTLASKRSSSVI